MRHCTPATLFHVIVVVPLLIGLRWHLNGLEGVATHCVALLRRSLRCFLCHISQAKYYKVKERTHALIVSEP